MSTLYSISSDTLTGLADAVRGLTGESGTLSPSDMINGIEGHVCPSPTIQSLSVTQNGVYTAPSGVDGYSPVTVNVSGGGGGGIEYETGTYTPTADTAKPTISFANQHTSLPMYVCMYDATGDYLNAAKNAYFIYVYYAALGNDTPIYKSSSTTKRYGEVFRGYGSSMQKVTSELSSPQTSSASYSEGYPRYWVGENGFNPWSNNSNYWKAGRTYKWIAIWAPTT